MRARPCVWRQVGSHPVGWPKEISAADNLLSERRHQVGNEASWETPPFQDLVSDSLRSPKSSFRETDKSLPLLRWVPPQRALPRAEKFSVQLESLNYLKARSNLASYKPTFIQT